MEDEKKYADQSHILCRRFDGISVESVLIAEILKGKGTGEDPCRISKVFFDKDGNYLFELDSCD